MKYCVTRVLLKTIILGTLTFWAWHNENLFLFMKIWVKFLPANFVIEEKGWTILFYKACLSNKSHQLVFLLFSKYISESTYFSTLISFFKSCTECRPVKFNSFCSLSHWCLLLEQWTCLIQKGFCHQLLVRFSLMTPETMNR